MQQTLSNAALDNRQRRLADTKQLAQYTRTSESFWEKDRLTGATGCQFYRIGRRILYDLNEIDEWLKTRQRRNTSEMMGV
jgi:hypothetical protein